MLNHIYTKNSAHHLPPVGYLESATGSGKSTLLYSQLIERSNFSIQIVVREKLEQLDEFESELKDVIQQRNAKDNVVKIHTDSVKEFLTSWRAHRVKHGRTVEDLADLRSVNSVVQHWLECHAGAENSCDGVTGYILLITGVTVENLSKLSSQIKSQCDCWFDELPSITQSHEVTVKNNPGELKDLVRLNPQVVKRCETKVPVIVNALVVRYPNGKIKYKTIDDTVHAVEPTPALRTVLSQHGHNFSSKALKDLLQAIASDNKTVYVEKSQWDLMEVRLAKSEDVDKGKTFFQEFTCRKLFSGWRTLSFISADFSRSMFNHYFCKHYGVRFVHHNRSRAMLKNKGFHAPELLNRMHFVVLMTEKEDRRNSKWFLEEQGGGKKLDARLTDLLAEVDEPVLICTNTKRKTGRKLLDRDCEVISSKTIGSNKYQHISHVVFDASLNPSPKEKKMLNLFGFDDEVIYQDRTLNCMYQVISRCSLRDSNSTSPIFVYLPNMESAHALGSRFAANTPDVKINIRRFDGKEFTSTPIAASPVASQHQVVENHSQCEFLLPLMSNKGEGKSRTCPYHGASSGTTGTDGEFPATPTAKPFRLRSARFGAAINLYERKNSSAGDLIELKPTKFASWLHERHNEEVHDRSVRPHLSPAMVIQHLDRAEGTRQRRSTSRGYENFVEANVLVVDFDGHADSNNENAVTKSQFISYFDGNKKKGEEKCCFVICSTHNTVGRDPYKFRAFFFLKQPATTVEEYKACYRYIDETLAKHGHGRAPFNGLDRNSQNPVHLYYVPGTNVELKEFAFFESINLKKDNRDAERYGLDPAELLEQYPPATNKDQYKHVSGKPTPKSHFGIESVKQQYRALSDGRRLGLKIAGKRMATTGAMYAHEVEQELHSLVDTQDPEMLKRVKDTMTQLHNEVQWW
ncbi:MAG: hypothetical protein KUF75_07800 [Candidatus Thiodiazotropha sp. (ex Ctena orbiculata)]|nr:hypothetical protein [Candidatus Thiodiazotropha taylori]